MGIPEAVDSCDQEKIGLSDPGKVVRMMTHAATSAAQSRRLVVHGLVKKEAPSHLRR